MIELEKKFKWKKLLTMDTLVPLSMKNVAMYDISCEL